MKKTWELSRRTFLRGAGAAVALPALEAMWPSMARAAAAGETPLRFLFYFTPNGFYPDTWDGTPEGPLTVTTPLSPTLASLDRHKSDLLILSGLDNRVSEDDIAGNHARATAAFLTCQHVTKDPELNVGVSIDQVIAQALAGKTRLPSLELGIEGDGNGSCDSGYSCAYIRNISWASASTPLAKETRPKQVFDRLFAGHDPGQTQEQIARRALYKKSILDFVLDDATRLEARLGTNDRQKLDEFLTGVRELERRVAVEPPPEAQACVPGAPPPAAGTLSRQEHVDLMSDLLVMAFRCDLTRVASFMVANGYTNYAYQFLGVGEGHHELSHHRGSKSAIEHLKVIDAWEVAQWATLLDKLKSVPEGTGNLLGNSLVFFSSELSNGDRHHHHNLPVVLAGQAGGRVRTGRHLFYQGSGGEFPLGGLFISMAGMVGAQLSSFGEYEDGEPHATAPLEGWM